MSVSRCLLEHGHWDVDLIVMLLHLHNTAGHSECCMLALLVEQPRCIFTTSLLDFS